MGFLIENGVLEKYTEEPGVTEVVVPDGVTEILFWAFHDCTSLTSITIPDSLTEIGFCAFEGCTLLTSIIIPNSVTKIGKETFKDCTSLTSITLPDGVKEIGGNAFSGTPWLENFPNDFVIVGDSLLIKYKGSDKSVTVADSVTEIGNYAFSDCKKLTRITLPNSVTKIGDHAFMDCKKLTSITLPDSVTEIGDGAFYNCSSLTSITLPDSVTEIDWYAFSNCKKLKSITIPDGVTKIGYHAFSDCKKLACITLPNSLTEIGEAAFEDCTSLKSITLPDSLKEIDRSAFSGCSSLEKLTIFGCTVNNSFWNWEKVQLSEIKSMLDKKEYNVTMDHPTKYMFVTQVLLNTDQPEAAAYVKKNFTKFAQFSIDRNRMDELKKYVEFGFFTKANIGKHTLYAMNCEKKNKEIILYLLSVKDSLGGFKLEEIDKYIELSLNDVELTSATLEYKNKYFTSEQVQAAETDKIDKELGFKERTAADWKKIYAYEIKDGEVTITAYKGSDLDVIVPDSICGKPVTAIGDMAFSLNKPRLKKEVKETLLKLKSVYIGQNIKTFGDDIFVGCLSLKTVTLFEKTVELSNFGKYNSSPIKWIPLNIDFKKRTMLIIAEKPVCDKPYNEEFTAVTWERCTLRKWLNEDFYSSFTDEEKAMIIDTTVVNRDNKKYGTKGGNDTTDKIFLLSIEEAEKQFANDASRAVGSWWWLRSPGYSQNYAAGVDDDGSLYLHGHDVRFVRDVCPALNLKF